MHAEIREMEERLRNAVLTSNVAELETLIDDRLLFIGPDGAVYGKADDLELHRSGAERVTCLGLEETSIEVHGSTAIAVVRAKMAGVFKGQAFEGHYRYIRTWLQDENGWRIVAGSVCALPE